MTDHRNDASRALTRRGLLIGAGAACGTALAGPSVGQHVFKEIGALQPGEFTWHPERSPFGPVSIIVSLDEQRVHVYRNGVRIAVSTCSTGRPGHATPTGVFVILQKDRDHRSSTYNNAPMPNMNRLTWDGIALHAGNLPGYPASHGCVRLPLEFSALLFEVTHLGTPVIIADAHRFPLEVAHPGMVLSGTAVGDFDDVLATLAPRKHPADWDLDDAHPITSVIASAHDARLVLLENDREIASGQLIWDGAPLGAHVFTLKGTLDGAEALHWESLSYAPNGGSLPDLQRVRSDADFTEMLKAHVHPGMIFVLTDLPLHPDRRSGRDFVIMN